MIWEEIYSDNCTNMWGENILLKGVLDILIIVYNTFMFGKKFIPKIVSIFGKKILLKVVLDIVTIIPYFIIWEDIYSEICTNIWEEISS